MSATARHEHLVDGTAVLSAPIDVDEALLDGEPVAPEGTEYATRGARRSTRPNLRMVSPLRPERASRGVFALVVVGMLILGMIVILVINTSLAQGAFTLSELQGRQATLTQQEQALSQSVAGFSAPDNLEKIARAMGMVPSQSPVFLKLPHGRIVGNAKPAPGGTAAEPRLLTPADATATEAVDNASVGTDLPIAPGPNYDPAAADAAAAQAKAASEAAARATKPVPLTPGVVAADVTPGAALSVNGGAPVRSAKAVSALEAKPSGKAAVVQPKPAAKKAAAAKKKASENSLWSDSTAIDVTVPLASNDAGLVAVRVQ